MSDLISRLRSGVRSCPFDKGQPDPRLEPTDPCPACGMLGTADAEDLCGGGASITMKNAADEIERLRKLAKELSDTLLTVAPLGGSECFVRRGEDYYADPVWFRQRIKEIHDSRHEALKRAVLAERKSAVTGG